MNTLALNIDLEEIEYTRNRIKMYGEMPTKVQVLELLNDVENLREELEESSFDSGQEAGMDSAAQNLTYAMRDALRSIDKAIDETKLGEKSKLKLQSMIKAILEELSIYP